MKRFKALCCQSCRFLLSQVQNGSIVGELLCQQQMDICWSVRGDTQFCYSHTDSRAM